MNKNRLIEGKLLANILRDGMVYSRDLDGIHEPEALLADVLRKSFDREQHEGLLAWVRDFMRERHESYVAARLRAGAPADGFGIRATRDPVSRDVAVALGFTSNPFEPQHGTIVWALCEHVGWQDGLDDTVQP